MAEPPTTAKLILLTSLGELEVELWTKEAPKASRNFIQLALRGYYDGCQFFRVVPDFVAQTGDPTNTGRGGQSAFGQPFEDEFSPLLKFTRRGLLAMASPGPNLNGSQFYLTLGECPSLAKKSTIFGKVVGRTVFNMLKLQDLALEGQKPLHPPFIDSIKVLINPFRDLDHSVDLAISLRVDQQLGKMRAKANSEKSRAVQTRGKNLISFEEEGESEPTRIVSSHLALNDPMLLKQKQEDIVQAPVKAELQIKPRAPLPSHLDRIRKMVRQDPRVHEEVASLVSQQAQRRNVEEQLRQLREKQNQQLSGIRRLQLQQTDESESKIVEQQSMLTISQKRKLYLQLREREARRSGDLIQQLQQLGQRVRKGSGWFQHRLQFPVDGHSALLNAERRPGSE